MPGKKSTHQASLKAEAPQEAAAPEPSNQDSPNSSELPRSPASESRSAFGSIIGNIVAALNPLASESAPAANASETLGILTSSSQQERGIPASQNAEGSATSRWDKVRSSTLHIPATINDGVKQRSTDSNEEL
jgi:hypothetical protein